VRTRLASDSSIQRKGTVSRIGYTPQPSNVLIGVVVNHTLRASMPSVKQFTGVVIFWGCPEGAHQAGSKQSVGLATVATIEGVERTSQHGFQHIKHAERLPCCTRKGNRRGLARCLAQIDRL
jgi:hypothetical protein